MPRRPPDPRDLPSLPPGLVLAADIRGPWRARAYVVWLLLRFCLRLLNPFVIGSKIFIVAHAESRPPPGPSCHFTA